MVKNLLAHVFSVRLIKSLFANNGDVCLRSCLLNTGCGMKRTKEGDIMSDIQDDKKDIFLEILRNRCRWILTEKPAPIRLGEITRAYLVLLLLDRRKKTMSEQFQDSPGREPGRPQLLSRSSCRARSHPGRATSDRAGFKKRHVVR